MDGRFAGRVVRAVVERGARAVRQAASRYSSRIDVRSLVDELAERHGLLFAVGSDRDEPEYRPSSVKLLDEDIDVGGRGLGREEVVGEVEQHGDRRVEPRIARSPLIAPDSLVLDGGSYLEDAVIQDHFSATLKDSSSTRLADSIAAA